MSASLIGHCCKAPCFLALVVSTTWITLLYVFGLAIGAVRHKHWSEQRWRALLWGRCLMSALGQKQTFSGVILMSALPPKADIDPLKGIVTVTE